MSSSAIFPYGDSASSTCSFCGFHMDIKIAKQDGHNDTEEFNCLVCENVQKVMASLPINARNVSAPKNSNNDGIIFKKVAEFTLIINALNLELGELDQRHESWGLSDKARVKEIQDDINLYQDKMKKLKALQNTY